jgi:DNA-binding NarL/FixJ family response regulator
VAAILFLTSDLMFTSRVGAAAKSAGLSLVQVPNQAALPDKITANCRLALIDLTLENLNLAAAVKAIHVGAPTCRVVAYGPHVDEAALADANDAGCNLVLTRGQFNKQYVELLQAAAQA